jgi:hypothetical protein
VRPSNSDTDSLSFLHEGSIADFVNPDGFGYFKDRRQVAGFEPHSFSQVPGPNTPWRVQSLELVSLVLHDTPTVYVSDLLPRMNSVHDVPTRPLDQVERYGLATLRDGEDIFAYQNGEALRMLGAVRSLRQCVACHGGQRGDLLGAFSYCLTRWP